LKFDHYLSGDPDFTIITDHKPLLGLYKPGSRPPPRIERWALRIQHLNFRLCYEPGSKNAADVFSRQPTPPRALPFSHAFSPGNNKTKENRGIARSLAHVNPSEHADTRIINAITTASLPRACTIEQVKEPQQRTRRFKQSLSLSIQAPGTKTLVSFLAIETANFPSLTGSCSEITA
jgi:hypothetical protein